MKRLLLLSTVFSLATCIGLAISCASLRKADGSLNVPLILSDAQWGIAEACSQQWLPADACAFAGDALNTAQAIAAKNLPGAEKAVRQSLVDAEAKLPATSRLRPYLDAIIVLLPA